MIMMTHGLGSESVRPGWLQGVALTWEGGDGEESSGTGWVPSCRWSAGSSQSSAAFCGQKLPPKGRGE